MGKERETKWYEDIFTGAISLAIAMTFLFNGFSYLTSLILDEEGLKGKPTGQKAIVALLSLVEDTWWKCLFVLIFLALAFVQIRSGIQKHPGSK